jgi:transcriptional regulator with XRE-family HTH domain
MVDLKIIGSACKRVRREMHMTQAQVGDAVGYTAKTISAFERGRVNNAFVLLWYLEHGLTKYIWGGDNDVKTTHNSGEKYTRYNGYVNERI